MLTWLAFSEAKTTVERDDDSEAVADDERRRWICISMSEK
jgi:hypothetical protein